MATKTKIVFLAEAGLLSSQVHPNDVLIMIEGVDESSVTAAMGEAERKLTRSFEPSSLAGAVGSIPPEKLTDGA
jgi:hypothetical protein